MPITKVAAVSTRKKKKKDVEKLTSVDYKKEDKKKEDVTSTSQPQINGKSERKKTTGSLQSFFTFLPPKNELKEENTDKDIKLDNNIIKKEIQNEGIKLEDNSKDEIKNENIILTITNNNENNNSIINNDNDNDNPINKDNNPNNDNNNNNNNDNNNNNNMTFFQFDISEIIKGNEENERMELDNDNAPPGFEYVRGKSKLDKFREACREEDERRLKQIQDENKQTKEENKQNEPESPSQKKKIKTEKLLERMMSSPAAVTQPKKPVVVVVVPPTKRPTHSDPTAVPEMPPETKRAKTENSDTCLWVDKYKPRTLKEVVYCSRAVVDRLLKWLEAWKTTGKPPASDSARAVLISGPPGIGKTTTALLACEQVGMKPIELNASDARSRASIKELLDEALGNTSIAAFCQTGEGKRAAAGESGRSVIVMDEVDGMSSGDRGGVTELIAVVKKTRVPVICICNDRSSTKIRSLAAHCVDLRFQKPLPEQVCTRLVRISNQEHAGLTMNEGRRIAAIANCDIRQAIHLLYLTVLSTRVNEGVTQSSSSSPLSITAALDKGNGNGFAKDMDMNPFDVVPKIFAYPRSTLDQKVRYYFSDYGMVPMLVQENYLSTKPALCGVVKVAGRPATHMDLVARAADAISLADVLDGAIRRTGRWDMLTEHACLSTVYPAYQVQTAAPAFSSAGQDGLRLRFPAWLGKNSTHAKNARVLRDVQTHINGCVSAISGSSVARSELVGSGYLDVLARKVVEPLAGVLGAEERGEAVTQVVSFMERYGLDRADWESICDLSFGGREEDISGPTKTAFTKKLNAACEEISVVKGKKGAGKGVLDRLNEEGVAGDAVDDDNDNLENDFKNEIKMDF